MKRLQLKAMLEYTSGWILMQNVHFHATPMYVFRRPAPICPCSSVGRAMVICYCTKVVDSSYSEIFSLSPCGPISFLELSLRRCYVVYLLEHFNLPHLNHYHIYLIYIVHCKENQLLFAHFVEILQVTF